MTTAGALVRQVRQQADLTQEALAERLGCSKAHLSLMESGQRTVSEQWARRIEQALGCEDGRIVAAVQWDQTSPSVRARLHLAEAVTDRLRRALGAQDPVSALRKMMDTLTGNVDQALPMVRQIPVINRVTAGLPTEFTDLDYPAAVADDYIACPDMSDPDAFAARVVGDSMQPDYREGEIVVFSPVLPTPSGSDCFVRLVRDNEVTFKRVYLEDEGETIRLQPLNNAYAPRSVDREDVAGMYAAAYVLRSVGRGK